jgi:serine/threonine-protein kinase RsbT
MVNGVSFQIQTMSDVAESRRRGMQMALDMGFPRADATKVAAVISELTRNILLYAAVGTVTIVTRQEGGTIASIKVIAEDEGPGIPNIEQAMVDGFTTSGGLGLGLSGSKRLMDSFIIESETGNGTIITAEKWLR